VARLLTRRFEPSALVEGDAFFAFLAGGAIEPWLPESAAQNEVVIQAAATAAGRPAHRPEDVADRIVAAMADGSLRHPVRAR
jgi:hypothetical protein